MWCGVGMFIAIAIALSVGLSTHFATDSVDENRYTPGDSRLITLDTFFCRGAEVSSSDYGEDSPMGVYLLSKEPPLTDRNAFTVDHLVDVLEYDYKYWHFYLHPGSNVSVGACTSNARPYTFYVIEGSSDFNKWTQDASSGHSRAHLYVSRGCSQGNQTLSYRASRRGHYYFVYTTALREAKGNLSLHLERYEYSTVNISWHQFCQVSTSLGSCRLDVNVSSPYDKVLVKVPFDALGDFDSPYSVQYRCLPRPAAYVVVTVTPFVAVATCCLLTVLALLCYRRSRSKRYDPLLPSRDKTSQHDQPPPYNPNYK